MDYNEKPLLFDVLVQQGVVIIDEPHIYHHVTHQSLQSTLCTNESALHVDCGVAIHF